MQCSQWRIMQQRLHLALAILAVRISALDVEEPGCSSVDLAGPGFGLLPRAASVEQRQRIASPSLARPSKRACGTLNRTRKLISCGSHPTKLVRTLIRPHSTPAPLYFWLPVCLACPSSPSHLPINTLLCTYKPTSFTAHCTFSQPSSHTSKQVALIRSHTTGRDKEDRRYQHRHVLPTPLFRHRFRSFNCL